MFGEIKPIIPTNLSFLYFYLLCYDNFPNRSLMVRLRNVTTNSSGSARTISLYLQAGGLMAFVLCWCVWIHAQHTDSHHMYENKPNGASCYIKLHASPLT